MTHLFHILKSTNIKLDIRKIVGLSMRKRWWCLFDVNKPYILTIQYKNNLSDPDYTLIPYFIYINGFPYLNYSVLWHINNITMRGTKDEVKSEYDEIIRKQRYT